MRYEIHLKNGHRRRELVPVIRDIVFVQLLDTQIAFNDIKLDAFLCQEV